MKFVGTLVFTLLVISAYGLYDANSPVVQLTARNFEDLVINSNHVWVVEFYAPWCGHCKALAPKYDELAAKLAHIDDIVIAKMDSTANEVEGVNIRGFPTLKMWKKGSNTPIDFNGDREVDGFIEFFKQNGIEITDAPEAAATTDDAAATTETETETDKEDL
mmetsp:Transcript_26893/g.30977  ORF Transcript_26893/g.30977 Transcript_26893/m.30977 type:complete len:162 (-) Transcript_26893:20-505(-)